MTFSLKGNAPHYSKTNAFYPKAWIISGINWSINMLFKIKIEVEWGFNNIVKLICVKKVKTTLFFYLTGFLCCFFAILLVSCTMLLFYCARLSSSLWSCANDAGKGRLSNVSLTLYLSSDYCCFSVVIRANERCRTLTIIDLQVTVQLKTRHWEGVILQQCAATFRSCLGRQSIKRSGARRRNQRFFDRNLISDEFT